MFHKIAPPRAGQCHSLHYPLPYQESAPLGHTFALPTMKGPLSAELKLRENTADISKNSSVPDLLVSLQLEGAETAQVSVKIPT